MKLFIDSADLDEIKKAFSWGVVDGVTTNPSLLKKAVNKRKDVDLKSYVRQILQTAKGTPVSLEVTKYTAKEMIAQGRYLYKLFNPVAKNVYIKIPVNPSFKEADGRHFEGIEAIRALSKANIPVNCTLIFTPEQALLAAKAGAKFVSPFAGRVDDFIRAQNKMKFDKRDYFPAEGMEGLHDNGVVSGIDLVSQCVGLIESYGLKAEVLADSLRNTRQVREAALVGAHIATLPFSVIQELLKHRKTYEGMKKFTEDVVPEYEKL